MAVVSVGDPESRRTWSGIPAGVVGGLRQIGVLVHPVNLALPRGLEEALLVAGAAPTRNLNDREGSPLAMAVRARLARRRMPRGELDGVIQIGNTFILPPGISYVTLDDMTLRQGVRGYPVFRGMSAGAIESWERRRAEIYSRARICAVATRWPAESFRDDYGIDPSRIAVVGFGANHTSDVVERDWSVPHFLFIGVQWERKGGPMLLRAFARVRELHPDATLDLVGRHPTISQPGVTGHGRLSPQSEHDRGVILGLLRRCTCFVMPSLIEPFGITYVEAGSAGMPSIGSAVGGAPEVIGEHGGMVVDPGDEDALIAAMLELCDPVRAMQMGSAARERSDLYTWPKVAERLLRALGLPAPDGQRLADFL